MRASAIFPSIALVALACGCTSAKRDNADQPAAIAALDGAVETAAIDAGPVAPACAPFDTQSLAPFATCDTKVVKTPVPDLVDPNGTLDSFWEKLAELERGTAKKRVRIAIYGDSNLTSDFLPGHLRRILQTRYGDAGHGWVSFSRPWLSYRHEDIAWGGYWGPIFTYCAPTTNICHDKHYGFANMAAETSDIGAQIWAGTTKDPKAIVGQAVSHFELHYMKKPNGGSFTVQIDKKDVKKIDTKSDEWIPAVEDFDVEEGPHELRTVVRGDGNVRFFGVSLDRVLPPPKPGIQIDSLGAGSLNYERLRWVKDDSRRVQLVKRGYDLVVIWLGMNVMFVPPNKEYAKEFIAQIRAALPNAAILILGPSDTVREGEKKSDPRIIAVAKQMREVADEAGVAFWDFREAMGGEASVIPFTKRGLTGPDHIHFGPEGAQLMGTRLLCAFSTSFSSYLGEHRDAGCAKPGASPEEQTDGGNGGTIAP